MNKLTVIIAGYALAASLPAFAQARKWTTATLPPSTAEINSIATDGNIAVAVGYKGQILRSSDGKSWAMVSSNTTSGLYSVDYDSTSKAFYISGGDGVIMRSSDGKIWTNINHLNKKKGFYLFGVARAGDKLIAAGTPGSFLSSKDGKNWTKILTNAFGACEVRPVSFGTSAGLIEIYSDSGKKGQVWRSNDGYNISKLAISPSATHFTDSTIFDGNVYLAASNGNLYSSPIKTAGGSWKTISTPANKFLSSYAGLTSNTDFLTAVGDKGMVYTLFKNTKTESETINLNGIPSLSDVIHFKDLIIVTGGMYGKKNSEPAKGFIATTQSKWNSSTGPNPNNSLIMVYGGIVQFPPNKGQSVSEFQIGKHEVTWGEWKEVRSWAVTKGYSDLSGVGKTYPINKPDNFPVINVSWYDVLKWCNAKSEKEGLTPVYLVNGSIYRNGESFPTTSIDANGYRLPLEIEWEWAARGGSFSKNYTYSGSNDANAVAWHSGNSGDPSSSSGGTKAVGTKAPNELGIFDMSGNVHEWCGEAFSFGPMNFSKTRGGSWNLPSTVCQLGTPADSEGSDVRYANHIGFRLVRNYKKP